MPARRESKADSQGSAKYPKWQLQFLKERNNLKDINLRHYERII